MPKQTLVKFGGVLKLLTQAQRLTFVQLLIDLHDRRQVATEGEDECAICLPANNAYWQQNFGENWQAAHDAYCAELECD